MTTVSYYEEEMHQDSHTGGSETCSLVNLKKDLCSRRDLLAQEQIILKALLPTNTYSRTTEFN